MRRSNPPGRGAQAVQRYLVVLPTVLMAVLLHDPLRRVGLLDPHPLYMVAVVLMALRGGEWAGLLALGLTTVLHWRLYGPVPRLNLGVYWATGASFALLAAALKRQWARAEQLYADAQLAAGERDKLFLTASYELQVPMASLILLVKEVGAYQRENEIRVPKERFEAFQAELQKVHYALMNLTELARISAGKVRVDPQAVDVSTEVRRVVQTYQDEVQRSGSTLTLRLTECKAVVDVPKLRQVVMNLLSNALKFGAGAEIEVSVEPKGTEVELAVIDHGVGIPEDAKQRIFERFARVSMNPSGLGLGLWVVHNAVTLMKGRIDVGDTTGGGTTFRVWLPSSP